MTKINFCHLLKCITKIKLYSCLTQFILHSPPLLCAIVASPSRSLLARFRPAWLIVADFATSFLRELCRFPLLNYSVFVAVADWLRVLFSSFVLDKSSRQLPFMGCIAYRHRQSYLLSLCNTSFIAKLKIHRGRNAATRLFLALRFDVSDVAADCSMLERQ